MNYAPMAAEDLETLDAFVARLRAVRIELKLTLAQVAERCGAANPTVVGNWETGVRRPRHDLLTAWAAALGVDIPAGVHGWRPSRLPCGTVAGAATHRRRGEPECRPCRDACNTYQRARRRS